MKILFLSYWSIEDGLAKSTVLPHVEILCNMDEVEQVHVMSIEREKADPEPNFEHPKFHFSPLVSKYKSNKVLNKLYDFFIFPRIVDKAAKKHGYDLIIARGAMTPALAFKAIRNNGIKLIAESFEPHSDYMTDAGVWSEGGLFSRVQNSIEKKVKKRADNIYTVSNNYKRELIRQGIDENRVTSLPCAVKAENFHFDEIQRKRIREELGFQEDDLVGINVGKFGGIYFHRTAFRIFNQFLLDSEKNKLILLSPDDKDVLYTKLEQSKVDISRVKILKVPHHEVSNYLSASDFGFALIRTIKSQRFSSPIKIGEYWANGLPTFITPNIGDDSEIIQENEIGGLLDLKTEDYGIANFLKLLRSKSRLEWNDRIYPFASKYRSFNNVEEAYKKAISEIA